MKMLRHYFISDSLDDLEKFEDELEARGVATQQIHVLSLDDPNVSRHGHLHAVHPFLKSDVVHSASRGIVVGVVLAALLLLLAHFAGWTMTAAGWMPFIFLAIVLLGFCTWEAGFMGFQKPNHNYARFEQALKNGKHVFLVDLEPAQEASLEQLLKLHPKIELAGTGASAQHWLVVLQQRLGIGRRSADTA